MTRYDGLPLSPRARAYLAARGIAENSDTPGWVAEQLATAGLPVDPRVVDTFYRFGGVCLHLGVHGRFKVHRIPQAIRALRHEGHRTLDADRCRIPFGESETIQAAFLMDGHGRLYEDARQIAAGMVEWIETLSARDPDF